MMKKATKASEPPRKTTDMKRLSFGKVIKQRVDGLLARRPHRSFRRTRRRDYARSLKLPGYWAFTSHVWQTIWRHKKLFGLMGLVYALLSAALIGIASQGTYMQLSEELRTTGSEVLGGDMGALGEAGLLLVAGMAGGFSGGLTDVQQIYTAIILLFTWLTTVWLLRAILAGRTPRLRDGLYSSGAPVLSTFLVGLVFVVQLLPLALAIIAYGVATSTGLLASGGVELMLFCVVALLLGGLSLYWGTSTIIAMVVVTLPGMYPLRAVRTAGDLAVGRRLRILLRLLWMLLLIGISWVVIVVPVMLFDTWLKGLLPAIEWLPLVPIVMLVMSTASVIWAATYVYLLYRRIVDDDAAPA